MPDTTKGTNTSIRKNRSNGRFRNLPDNIIQLHNVVKVYESGAGNFVALKGITLSVQKGEFLAIVGKSGSGKSTLLNMLTGIDRPTSGQIIINRTPIHRLSEGKMAVWRGNNVGVVFQFFQLLPTLTVLENIILPMDFCKKYSLRERKERALYLLREVELIDQANKLPSALSGGQQQRVAIARALANDPPILVADEPTGNLDSKTATAVFQLFTRLIDQGKTIIMVTHDQDLARQVSRTIYLVDGQIFEDSRQDDLISISKKDIKATDEVIVDRDKESQIKIAIDENVLVQSISEKSNSSGSVVTSPTVVNQAEIERRIRSILLNRSKAVQLLKDEFVKASDNLTLMNALYEAVLNQVNSLASEAEKEHRPEEAKQLWKIVMDATESWANIETDN